VDIDEEYATALLSRLDEPPLHPSTVDIMRAVRDGRRRRRIRRATRLAAAVMATVVVLVGVPVAAGALRHHRASTVTGPAPSSAGASPSASASSSPMWQPVPNTSPPRAGLAPNPPTTCTLARLPVPDGVTMSIVTAEDPTGHYIAGRSYPRGGPANGYPIIIWHDGKPTVVTIPGNDQSLEQITPTGDAVGQSYLDSGIQVAWAYLQGSLRRLEGTNAEARGINTAGAIVGKVGARPVVWRTQFEPAEQLPMPPGTTTGEAYGIADDGTIVGTLQGNDGEHAYVWRPDGSVSALPAPANPAGARFGERVFVLRDGWAGGLDTYGGSRAVRWNLRTSAVTLVPALDISTEAVNRYGWTVGSDKQGYGVLQTDVGTVRLPPINKKVEPTDNIASGISDDGRTIGGQAVLANADRTIVAVVWRCT
jgi:uncharacterized membrane protein